jgi:ABC-type polysaccharide/polyol phosphate export permease
MAAISPPPRAVTVYEPTVTGLPPMGPYLRAMWDRRPFMWHLARTELKARHYDTALGQVWVILDPLLMAAVYYLLRTVVRPIGALDRNFLIDHLIWAVFFFQYTSKSLRQGAQSILGNKQMVLNTAFPRAIFPVVAVLVALLDFLPTLLVYFVLHALLGFGFGASFLFLPLMIFMLTMFNLGCALLYAPLTVFFRDTSALLPYLTQIWTYMTPVLYTVQEIPPNLLVYLRWNPLYPFWAALEQIFGGQMPSPGYLLAAGAWGTLFFVGGGILFLLREGEFAIRF